MGKHNLMKEPQLINVIGLIGSTTHIVVYKDTESITMTSKEWYQSNHKWLSLAVVQLQVETNQWNTISILLMAGQ